LLRGKNTGARHAGCSRTGRECCAVVTDTCAVVRPGGNKPEERRGKFIPPPPPAGRILDFHLNVVSAA
jgi:hypothetical protein